MAKETKEDGDRVVEIPLVVKHGDRIYPALSLVVVCVALNVNPANITIGRKGISIPTRSGVINIPTDEKGQLRVNYLGDTSVFLKNTYSLSAVYESIYGCPVVQLESFKDSIVLMGTADIMGADMYSTPFGNVIPGVATHAMVVNSILQGRFINTASWYYNLLILVVSVVLISYTQKLLSPRTGLVCLVALLIFIWFFSAALFQFKGTLIDVSQPIFGATIVFVSTSFYNYIIERKRLLHIRHVFGKHVSQEIVDQLVLETDGHIPMAEREVSALFADISDHSNWAKSFSYPSEFAKELNQCLEAMAQAVSENRGTINRFLGDGLLALYNAPLNQSDHALRAVRTGISIQERISKLNEERIAQDEQPLAVRIGINSGIAMAGTLGSKDRLEYTVIGDTINMAKRAEGECQPGRIAITDDVVRKVGEAAQVEPIGLRPVKGRELGLMLYHVVKVREDGNEQSGG